VGDVTAQAPAMPGVRPFDVLHYRSRLEPDIAARTITGTVVIRLRATADTSRVELDRGDLAIRQYTRTHFGGSVTTEDFKAAMERASGRDLMPFFAEWVYLAKTR
jgi:aminopeptidase N